MTHPNPDPLTITPPDPAPLRRGIAWGLILEVVVIAVVFALVVAFLAPRAAASAGEDYVAPMPNAHSTVIGSVLSGGEASWYDDGPGLYGAVHSYRWGDPRYFVKVCRADAAAVCVRVVVRDHMANKVRAIDLSPEAFAALAPLSRGVVQVTVDTYDGAPKLPETDTSTAP